MLPSRADGSSAAVLAVFSAAELKRDAGHLTDAETGLSLCPATAARRWHSASADCLSAKGSPEGLGAAPSTCYALHAAALERLRILLCWVISSDRSPMKVICRCALPTHRTTDLFKLGLAAQAVTQGDPAQARRLLSEIVAANHDSSRHKRSSGTAARRFRCGLARMALALACRCRYHSRYWFVRGIRAHQQSKLEVAARCFWEALLRVPVHRRATYQLGQALTALGEPAAGEFAMRSASCSS